MPELPNPWDAPHFVTARYLTSRSRDRREDGRPQDYFADSQVEAQASSMKAPPAFNWGALPGSGHCCTGPSHCSGPAEEAFGHLDSSHRSRPDSSHRGGHHGHSDGHFHGGGTESGDAHQASEELAEEVVFGQSSERAARLMRNEHTLKQLAEGAQRLLEKAKLQTDHEGWEDSHLRDHYDYRRGRSAHPGRLPSAACPAEDTEEGDYSQVPAYARDPLLATRTGY